MNPHKEFNLMEWMYNGTPGIIIAWDTIEKNYRNYDPHGSRELYARILHENNIDADGFCILWVDELKWNVKKFIFLVRAVQFGHFSASRLRELCEDEPSRKKMSEEEWKSIYSMGAKAIELGGGIEVEGGFRMHPRGNGSR